MAAEIPDGAVLVARALLNSSLWTMRPEDCKLAITCICMANWRQTRWFDGERAIDLRRGEFVSSRDKLAEACHLSVRNVRTGLKNLRRSGFLALKTTKRYTVLFLPKYALYQDMKKYYGQKYDPTLPHERPTGDHRQEEEEVKEGGAAPPAAPPGGEDAFVEACLEASRFCSSPRMESRLREFKDLFRQAVPLERIRAAFVGNPKGDFYGILKGLRNGRSPTIVRPERIPRCARCQGSGCDPMASEKADDPKGDSYTRAGRCKDCGGSGRPTGAPVARANRPGGG